jgi:hypothetical protein
MTWSSVCASPVKADGRSLIEPYATPDIVMICQIAAGRATHKLNAYATKVASNVFGMVNMSLAARIAAHQSPTFSAWSTDHDE